LAFLVKKFLKLERQVKPTGTREIAEVKRMYRLKIIFSWKKERKSEFELFRILSRSNPKTKIKEINTIDPC